MHDYILVEVKGKCHDKNDKERSEYEPVNNTSIYLMEIIHPKDNG